MEDTKTWHERYMAAHAFYDELEESVKEGYLSLEDRQNIKRLLEDNLAVRTDSGYVANVNYCVCERDGSKHWHIELDSDLFVWFEDEVWDIEDCEEVHMVGGGYSFVPANRVTYVGRDQEAWEDSVDVVNVADADYLILSEDAYYSEVDGNYYENPDNMPEEENENFLFDYHEKRVEVDIDEISAEKGFDIEKIKYFPAIGFEIEKSEMPGFIDEYTKDDMFDLGHVLQRDGSVGDGFELATKAYPLLSENLDNDIKGCLRPFIEAQGYDHAGGHIGFSLLDSDKKFMPGDEVFEIIKGYFPLIYSLFPGRINNDYCRCKKPQSTKEENEKYQAIKIHGEYLEFRIFGVMKSVEQVLWRVNLFRYIAENMRATQVEVIRNLFDKNSTLYKLMRDAYTDAEKWNNFRLRVYDVVMEYGDTLTDVDEKEIKKFFNK